MDRTLFCNQYLAVIDREGYTFTREVRCGGVIVAVVPFRTTDTSMEFLARLEVCPAHGPEQERCSITGGLEPRQTVTACARQELYEEAGYLVEEHELIHLGQVRPSKSADTLVHLFAVDVTTKSQHIAPGDGSRLEANAAVEWINYDHSLHLGDPLFITAVARLRWYKKYRHYK